MKLVKACGVFFCVIALLVAPGCLGKYTGGGWIPSLTNPDKKATFGFSMEAVETDSGLEVQGQLNYNDHDADVAFHAELINAATGGVANWGTFVGEYSPKGKKKNDGGVIVVNVIDELGANGDFIAVRLTGGAHDGYVNGGFLSGGSIKHHPPK